MIVGLRLILFRLVILSCRIDKFAAVAVLFATYLLLQLSEHILRAAVLAWFRGHVACYTTPAIRKNVIEAVIKGVKEVTLRHSILGLVEGVIDQVIVGQGLLVGLLELLTDILTFHEGVLMRLSCIVEVRVEVKELTPGQIDVVNVLVHLFAHVDKVLPRHRVVDHCDTTSLFVALRCEEGTLLAQVVDLLARVW